MKRVIPVSYTHLDVYKRQGLRCGKILPQRRLLAESQKPPRRPLFALNAPSMHINKEKKGACLKEK